VECAEGDREAGEQESSRKTEAGEVLCYVDPGCSSLPDGDEKAGAMRKLELHQRVGESDWM
jgi:hypothetical protein